MTRSTASSRSGSSARAGTWYGMRASRILAFARTMRCASVGAGVRNARAISSVVRPQTSRSVSATCASGARAGWQHVKISRSRSSSTLSSSAHAAGVDDGDHRPASPASSSASNRARRRMPIDGLESPGRHQPRARIGGDAVARPLLQRRRERIVQRFLGHVEVAEQADQRGQHAPRIGDDRRRSPSRARDRSLSRRPITPPSLPQCKASEAALVGVGDMSIRTILVRQHIERGMR